MTWGLSAWGLTPHGLDSLAAFYIVEAHPRGETVIRVTLSRAAAKVSSTAIGDALNPRTWTVLRNDTLQEFTVLSVREVQLGNVFELLLLQPLFGSGIDHTVKSFTLKAENGWLIDTPRSVLLDGCQADKNTSQASPGSQVDLAKPQLDDGLEGAVFRVGDGGDYDVESGLPYLRKLLIRRLTTSPAGFFHLPAYGMGLRLKEPMTPPRMVQLRAEIERQLLQEPDVAQARVSLRLGADGQLQILLAVKLQKSGAEVTDTFSLSPVGE